MPTTETRVVMLRDLKERAGFIAARRNAKDGGWNVLYRGEEQGIPAEDGGKYAIVCEAHGTLHQTNNMIGARSALRYPDFCDCCRGTCIPSWAKGEDWECPGCGANGKDAA